MPTLHSGTTFPAFPRGGGEMGERMRAFDWAGSPLGAPATWPHSLRSAVFACLNSPVLGTVLWGPDLCMLYNDAYIASMADRHPGALGRPVAEVWGQAWQQVARPFQRALETGEGFIQENVELQVLRNGKQETTWWRFTATPLLGDDGSIAGLLNQGFDITSQVQADRARQVESERHRYALQQMPGFVAILSGPRHVYEYVNDAYIAISGERAFLGNPLRTVFPELAGQGYFELLDQVYGTGQPFSSLAAPIRLRGEREERFIDLLYHPMRDEHGAITGIFVGGYDVTERIRVTREFRASQEHLQIALDAAAMGTWAIDLRSGIARRSERHDALFGYAAPQAAWDTAAAERHVAPADRPLMRAAHARALRDGELHYEVRIDHGAGERWIAVTGKVYRDEAGQALRMAGVVADVTERRRADLALQAITAHLEDRVAQRSEQLLKIEQELRQSQKMEAVGQLTGGVAHDFNNVLQIIAGNLQLLQLALPHDEPARHRIDAAAAAVERGGRLSAQLLAFARRQPLRPRVVDIGQLIAGMDELLRQATGEAVALRIHAATGLWRTLVDPYPLENVLLNLAINARDAMDGRGTLAIEIGNAVLGGAGGHSVPGLEDGDYVVIAVSDDGPGIPPALAEKIFEPFFTTKREGEGTGLGLSMAYGFLRQSGGGIVLDSTPGRGASFRLYLPRTTQALDTPRPAAPGPVVGGTETILVVEDNTALQATVGDMLRGLGYTVLLAGDAAQALALIGGGAAIDLLFSDVVMPGAMHGPQLAATARALVPGLAVLFTSGYTQGAFGREQLGTEVELIGKPYRREELALRLRGLLDVRERGTIAGGAAESGPPAPSFAATPRPAGAAGAPGRRVLLVEDNDDARELTAELLSLLGHQARCAASAELALEMLACEPADVLMTDITLPGMSGIELVDQVRLRYPGIETIFSSGHAQFANARATDKFLLKPFSIDQLDAMLRPAG
ncbi:response regulator [Massilia jejuensis]|uniref:histidine kinase n=1 Tax=Massilia jejuensis TaxID=648894 RepID=A0ABW0PI39_9BURK